MLFFVIVAVVSLVAASFFGHFVHWGLHQRWTGPFFRAHLQHHEELYPPGHLVSDTYLKVRWYNNGFLLFTPPFIVLLLIVGGLLWLCGAPNWVVLVFGIAMLGLGIVNDVAHDSYHVRHQPMMRFKWYRRMRTSHFLHHLDVSKNFGIFYFFWDDVFGTRVTKRSV